MKFVWVALLIIILGFAIGIYLYPSMPEVMASHWNASGNVDGYMPKFWALFLMPIINLALLGLFYVIPKIDPLKHNIKKFKGYYERFVLLVMGFLLYLYLVATSWSLGARFNFIFVLMPALAVLFFYVGVLLEKTKRNWFIGIRTPWTMSSDKVWKKTHDIGGKLFKIYAVLLLLSLLLPNTDYVFIFVIIVPIIVIVIALFAYSYYEYKKIAKNKRKRKSKNKRR